MKIARVINNNVVCAYNENNKEVVIMGKGIGFRAKEGQVIDPKKIEKTFIMNSQSSTDKFKELLENLPIQHFKVSSEIISYAKEILGGKLNQNIYITLTDHINFAVQRFKNGMKFSNPLLWEVKQFYKNEFLVGQHAVGLIEKRLGVKMTDDEAANIALHIVNAEYNTAMRDAVKITTIISDVTKIVAEFFDIELDEESLHYSRFITHLKFFCQRLFTNELLENTDKVFVDMIITNYPKEYLCSLKVKQYIEEKYIKSISDEEMVYLTVHIKRLCMLASDIDEWNIS